MQGDDLASPNGDMSGVIDYIWLWVGVNPVQA